MPPLASAIGDEGAVKLLLEWIGAMKPEAATERPK
jgi:hypothetical protein